jgi:hypothetical protein
MIDQVIAQIRAWTGRSISVEPLRMTSLQGVPVIYSVGPDGKDDKAAVVWNLNPGQPGDYVFRLEPPTNR